MRYGTDNSRVLVINDEGMIVKFAEIDLGNWGDDIYERGVIEKYQIKEAPYKYFGKYFESAEDVRKYVVNINLQTIYSGENAPLIIGYSD